jgi:hypothetical protein
MGLSLCGFCVRALTRAHWGLHTCSSPAPILLHQVVFVVARGDERHELTLRVEDLCAAVPSSFLEVGDCVFNDLSLQTARHFNLPVGGAFVAKAGYMLMAAGSELKARAVVMIISIIIAMGHTRSPTLPR